MTIFEPVPMSQDNLDKLTKDAVTITDHKDGRETVILKVGRNFYSTERLWLGSHWYYSKPVEVKAKQITSIVWEEVK